MMEGASGVEHGDPNGQENGHKYRDPDLCIIVDSEQINQYKQVPGIVSYNATTANPADSLRTE